MTSRLRGHPTGIALAALVLAPALALAACATPADDSSDRAPAVIGDGHGEIEGAHELAEPALHLTTVDPQGVIHHLDLLDEETAVLDEVAPAEDVVTDGRYLFIVRDGSVSIVDSGVWTWSHVDHFHYYEAPSRMVGELTGPGVATVVPGDRGVGVLFEGEAVLLDTQALADGDIEELFRADVEPHAGFVVPLADGAFVTEPDGDGLRTVSADGVEGDRVECAEAAGTITTAVGTVVGCADGALLAVGGAADELERIPYPADGLDAVPAASAFAAREGRPTVAAVAGDSGIWMLDTRERSWKLLDAGEPIVHAAAVDDSEEHVVALTADGAVLVLSAADGTVLARTGSLAAASLADVETAAHVSLVVDQSRIYLNGPEERMLWEIDPADGARVAREFPTGHQPLHLAGTGR